MSPNAILASELLAAGWAQIPASSPDAYRRDGAPYLTWRKGAVTVASSATERRRNPESGGIEAWIAFGGASVTIEVLFTEPNARGGGEARRALLEWVSLARSAGVTLFLEPCPQERSVNSERLVQFYREAGFRESDPLAFVMVCRPTQSDERAEGN